jgi:endonuclease-3
MAQAFGVPAFPVDTHILRVGKRLGLIPEDADANAAHEVMGELVPKEKYVSFHINLIRLGRELCRPKSPKCETCPARKHCPFGTGVIEK